MEGSLLFVYGTMLKKGRNHGRLFEAGAICLGEAQTVRPFSLYVMDRNGAPIAIRDADEGYPVRGELYAVLNEAIMEIIDPMEGHPDYYRREWVSLNHLQFPGITREIVTVPAQMYVFQKEPLKNDRRVAPKGRVLAYDP